MSRGLKMQGSINQSAETLAVPGSLCDIALPAMVISSSYSPRETSFPMHGGMALPYGPSQTRM